MKQKISYSSVLSGITIFIVIAFIAIFVLFWVFIDKPYDNVFFWILIGLFCLCFLWIFGTTPDAIDADDDYDYINESSPFRTKKIKYSEIKSAEPVDASRGKKGFHFHGKFKNPVLITFKDGTEYVIGSNDAKQLADYINGRVNK